VKLERRTSKLLKYLNKLFDILAENVIKNESKLVKCCFFMRCDQLSKMEFQTRWRISIKADIHPEFFRVSVSIGREGGSRRTNLRAKI